MTFWKLYLILSSGVKMGRDPMMSDVGDRNAYRLMDDLMKADPASETLYIFKFT
jgi:hypothetical protein